MIKNYILLMQVVEFFMVQVLYMLNLQHLERICRVYFKVRKGLNACEWGRNMRQEAANKEIMAGGLFKMRKCF